MARQRVVRKAQMQLPLGRFFVQPIPASARELEVDAEIKRHPVREHLGKPWRQVEGKIGVEHKTFFHGPQPRLAHLDVVRARERAGEQDQ